MVAAAAIRPSVTLWIPKRSPLAFGRPRFTCDRVDFPWTTTRTIYSDVNIRLVVGGDAKIYVP